MKTLVYLASGNYRPEYELLDFDKVYLVDPKIRVTQSKKVECMKMLALDAFEYFKQNNITIDCLVSLCESRGEGGTTYSLCSDVFMGYFMQIMPPEFIWICNDSGYYKYMLKYEKDKPVQSNNVGKKQPDGDGQNYVSLDLPYKTTELADGDAGYINPSVFSSLLRNGKIGHVFSMKYTPLIREEKITNNISIRLIQDSIWKHYDELEDLFISFKLDYSPMKDYFEQLPKVTYYKQLEFRDCLHRSVEQERRHIGFTPHYRYLYDRVYQKQLENFIINHHDSISTPITIDFYYMNSRFKTRFIEKAIKTLHLKLR